MLPHYVKQFHHNIEIKRYLSPSLYSCLFKGAYGPTILNFINVSYLFTSISYLEKTYTITAQEPSIYDSPLLEFTVTHKPSRPPLTVPKLY